MADPIRGEGKQLDTFDLSDVAISADVNITGASSAAGTTLLTIPAFDCPGGDYYVDVFTPEVTKGTTNVSLELWDGATMIAALTGLLVADIARPGAILRVKVTLARAVKTLIVKGFVDAGTGVFRAGTGATGQRPNARARVRPA